MKRVGTRREAALARRATAGFTLIELLVVLVIIAVMSLLAAPSFMTFQRNSELTSAANNFLGALSAARAEAMKRQQNTYVVPADGSNWASGWVAFVDVNRNVVAGSITMEATTDIELVRQGPLSSMVTVVTSTAATAFADGTDKYAMFNGSGFMTLVGGGFPSGGANALDLTNGVETRRIIANSTGRLRICKPADTGCTATSL